MSVTRHLLPATFLAERDRFSLWVPVLLGVGIGIYFALPEEPSMRLPLALLALHILALRFRQPFARLAVVTGLLLTIGFSAAALRTQFVDAPMLHKTIYGKSIEGKIEDIEIRPKGQRLTLSPVSIDGVRERSTPERITLSLKETAPELKIGDRIRAEAVLFPPPTPAIPGGYDFARGFYFEGIGATGYAAKPPQVIEVGQVDSWKLWLNELRLGMAGRIRSQMGTDSGPVAAAMMVGEESGISDTVKDAMRDAGIYHVLSISGLHMSIAVGLVYISVRLLLSLYMPMALKLPVKKIAASVGLLSAFIYLMLAGYPVPAVRSFVMVACVMVAVLLDRRGISLYSLAWAATLILLFHPEALVGASFQLSFAATLAIIALYERYAHLLHVPGRGMIRNLGTYFTGLMLTSLAATIATTPLVIYHFNRFTVWGIVANMLMVPLASFWIMPAAVLAFLAMPFGWEAWPLALLNRGVQLMLDGAHWIAAQPYASFSLPSPTFGGLLLTVFGLLWLCLWHRRWRYLGVPMMVIGMCTIALYKPYDLLVSDDASKVMVRLANGEYLFVRGKPDSFDGEVWLRSAGKNPEDALTGDDKVFRCDKDTCEVYLEHVDVRVSVSKRKGPSSSICGDKTDIVITPGWVEGDCGAHVLDNRFLNDYGATGFYFTDGKTIMDTAFLYRGDRPWVSLPYSLYLAKKKAMMPADSDKPEEQNDRE